MRKLAYRIVILVQLVVSYISPTNKTRRLGSIWYIPNRTCYNGFGRCFNVRNNLIPSFLWLFIYKGTDTLIRYCTIQRVDATPKARRGVAQLQGPVMLVSLPTRTIYVSNERVLYSCWYFSRDQVSVGSWAEEEGCSCF
jgi:hypothetical protein